MRNFSKALENIRKVMHEQDAEFRREAGLAPREAKPAPKIPSLKPDPKPSHKDSGGQLSPDRFLNTNITPEPAPAPEFVEVIPQKDPRHSWLYNEVAKAVQNASGNAPNTKVVAVFVPVVQSGHELEELPVHETVELPPVHEEDFHVEDEIDIQQDPVPAEPEDDEPEDFVLNETKSVRLKKDALPEPDPEPEQAAHLDELLPESMEHPDPELAEAFTTMEEKLDESTSAENEQPESEPDITEDEDVSDGENMPFTEIPTAEDGEILPDAEILSVEDEVLPDAEILTVEGDGSLPDLEFPDGLEDDEIIDDIDESGEDSKAN